MLLWLHVVVAVDVGVLLIVFVFVLSCLCLCVSSCVSLYVFFEYPILINYGGIPFLCHKGSMKG